jgi:hypothetical protein
MRAGSLARLCQNDHVSTEMSDEELQDRDLHIGSASGRGNCVQFQFDDQPVRAYEGETVAMALWAAGVRQLRTSPVQNGPRGVFCGMGVCQECAVLVDGRRAEACNTIVRDGLSVRSLSRLRD